ncbi:LysR family transcriptional regulator [Bacillus sp. JJ1773]|uniref:LysR family transcriptional regulator n=1 Tax=Bacillus sp. JJ1773 TaxID=3122965 RepID=UPI002FFD63E6
MDEKDWNILLTLHEERNITKAAQRLYISQPALTYRIQQLEKKFDTHLVTRGKKGVEFTVQGEYLVEYAMDMVLQLQKTHDHILQMDMNMKGTLRLGVSSMFARYELPVILKNFLYQYPNLDINLKTGWSSKITEMVQRENVHLGIIRGEHHWQGPKRLIGEENICIASKKKIDFKKLPDMPRINYLTDPSLKNVLDNWWQETYNTPPLITMEVDRIETCKQMVVHGLGYAILPAICIKDEEFLFTSPIIMKDDRPLTRKTWMVYRESTLQLAYVNSFIDYLIDTLHRGESNNNSVPSVGESLAE